MTIFIYGLVCPVDNRIRYIGKSKTPRRRFACHRHNCLHKQSYDNTHLKNWWRKLNKKGKEPSLIILEECTEDKWKLREIYWINFYGIDNLCNMHLGGIEPPSAVGRKLTQKQRDDISKRTRGHKLWDKYPHPALGKPSPRKGISHSPESIEKMRQARLKYNPMKGKPISEHRRKLQSARLSVPVILLDKDGNDIQEFINMKEAAIALNVEPSAIGRVCRGEYKHTHGIRFRFK